MKTERICACGCGGEIIWKPYMKYYVPKYIRGHHLKNKTYEEIFGSKEKAKQRAKITSDFLKGKTYEEIHGIGKIHPLTGKTREEIYGREKSKKIKEKRKRTLKDKPEITLERIKKFKQTLKENPKIMINSEIKRQQTLKNNPKIIINAEIERRKTYKDNPKIKINANKKLKQTLKENPEIQKNRNKKRLQTYKENPKIMKQQVKKRLQTYKNDLNIQKNASKKKSAIMQGIDLKDWKKFIGKEPYSKNWDNIFKRRIRKRDNQVCMLCGIHREKLDKALPVHHINYDKKLTISQNCVSLCNTCHMRTNGNRKHWTKVFQSLLSEKYGYQYGETQEVIIKLNGEKNE